MSMSAPAAASAGVDRGYCLMIGGEAKIAEHLEPIFRALVPGVDAAPRTRGRSGAIDNVEQGFLHCGPHGAGHFVKMIHNGIEYGIMAAYAEGLNILRHADIGKQTFAHDAETTPLRDPQYYQYEMNLPQIAEVWRRGSVVGSWLLDLTAAALLKDPRWKATPGAFPTRAKDAGLFWPQSMKRFRRPYSARPSTNAFRRAARRNSPARCSRRCGTNSAATWRGRKRTRPRSHP